MIATIDVGLLFELVWAAALAGVAVGICFSLVILGSVRAGDLRREGRAGAAVAYGVMAIAGAVAIAAMIVYGISVIVSK
jgi:uncharacterized membrane protein